MPRGRAIGVRQPRERFALHIVKILRKSFERAAGLAGWDQGAREWLVGSPQSWVCGQGVQLQCRRAYGSGAGVLGALRYFWLDWLSLAWGQGDFVQSSNGMLTLKGSPFRFGGHQFLSVDVFVSVDCGSDSGHRGRTAIEGRPHVGLLRDTCGNGNNFNFQYLNTSTGAPAYNDSSVNGLANLDLAVTEANNLGIKLIMTLTNNLA